MTTESNAPPAAAMKLRLRDDLRAAMAGKRSAEVTVLRALLGALDQAEAVTVVAGAREHVSFKFGDPAVEIPRKQLSLADVRKVVREEHAELRVAADEYARLGQGEAAADFAMRAQMLERYLAPA